MTSTPDAAGWDHLGGGRWEAAREAFEQALAETEEPEAHEGLSWAAWWLDDAEVVFSSRERAYRLYRRRGEDAAAARMATWLAADQLDFHGAVAVARGWLQRARRLLEELEPGPDHGWLAFHEGYVAQVCGETDAAMEAARSAAEMGRSFEVPDLEMLGLALEGAALVGCGEVERGMRQLDESTALAMDGTAQIPISGAWACCFLVSSCIAVLDFDRARAWCDHIADFAERYGSRYMLAFCRAEYGTVHMWRGRWDEAEAVLEASIEDFTASRPAFVAAPLVGLAELRRRQGRHGEAARLLEEASPSGRAQVCGARIAYDRGELVRAVELLERLLRQTPDEQMLERFPALELLVRARAAAGDLEEGASALTGVRETARLAGTDPLGACADLAEGMLLAAGGDHDRARPLLEDAVDCFERCGGPFEAGQARLELAASLLALGRREQAGDEARAALASLEDLGAAAEAQRARQLLRKAGRSAPAPVTPREREVLGLVARGLTNREIAERLVLSEHTVHRHMTNILRKLDVPSRAAAAAHAVDAGWIEGPRA